MAVTHLLDTSVYCQRLRPKPVGAVVRRWRELGDEALCISVICEAEVLFGLECKQSDRLWLEYGHYLKGRLPVLPVDSRVVATYAKLKSRLWRAGEPRSDFDLLIAATAKVHGLIVATLNVRHLTGIPGVAVEDWGV